MTNDTDFYSLAEDKEAREASELREAREAKERKAYEEHIKEDHFNALLDYFCITEDPHALAVFVRAGGDCLTSAPMEQISGIA